MDVVPHGAQTGLAPDWPSDVFNALRQAGVTQAAYVPDAGHSRLIQLMQADASVRTVVLTTEEEGVALAAGAWLGGARAVLLMQSSGVGNCVNMLSLMTACRFPFLSLVTMRGEWAEFNPWQVPMGQATPAVLRAMGMTVLRLDRPEEAAEVVSAAAARSPAPSKSSRVIATDAMPPTPYPTQGAWTHILTNLGIPQESKLSAVGIRCRRRHGRAGSRIPGRANRTRTRPW